MSSSLRAVLSILLFFGALNFVRMVVTGKPHLGIEKLNEKHQPKTAEGILNERTDGLISYGPLDELIKEMEFDRSGVAKNPYAFLQVCSETELSGVILKLEDLNLAVSHKKATELCDQVKTSAGDDDLDDSLALMLEKKYGK